MFLAAIKDRYGDIEYITASTEAELANDIKSWIEDNVSLDDSVEVMHFAMVSKEKVSYELVYTNLLSTKSTKTPKALPEI